MEFFETSGEDNGALYFTGVEAAPSCPVCRLADRLDWADSSFEPPPRTLDFGYTYDGMPIASARFAEACRQAEGAQFLDLPNAPGWFLLVVERTIPDDGATTMRRYRPCPKCERSTELAGPRPTLLAQPLPGFSRTTSVFGSASDRRDRVMAQRPRLVIDKGLWTALEKAGLAGIEVAGRYEVRPITQEL